MINENPAAPTPKKPKLSYRFLRPATVASDTEIMTQRAMLRQETQGAYARMGYSMKAAELVRMAFNYFSRIEAVIGKDLQRRMIDIDNELGKLDKEADALFLKKKNPKAAAELVVVRRKIAGFEKQAKDLKTELKAEQDEFVGIMDQFQKFSAKLEEVKVRTIGVTRKIEEEANEIFRDQRRVRLTAKKTKKEKPTIVATEQELIAAATQEIQTAEKSRRPAPASKVVKKGEKLPPGYKSLI
jgi:predicted nuclease with TOPRIM domain